MAAMRAAYTRWQGRPGEVGGAALVLAPYLVTAGALLTLDPPTPPQIASADPLVGWLGAWGCVLAAVIVVGVWLWRWPPERDDLGPALAHGLAGAVAGAGLLLLVRAVAGPELPDFIPPEESAAPGLAQGLTAGVVEEAVFRLAVLPAVFLATTERLGDRRAAALAIGCAALAFAASHELGPGANGDARLFATRVVVPGVLMGVFFFRPGPAFIVSAHCAAHVLMPHLFR